MEQTLGSYLRSEREDRRLELAYVARTTKIPLRSLERLEAGAYGTLPAEVFVRGFIRSYARAVGIDDEQALLRYDEEKQARQRAVQALQAQAEQSAERAGEPQLRRRVGLAVFVVILLIIATITLSLILRRPHHIDAGVSASDPVTNVDVDGVV